MDEKPREQWIEQLRLTLEERDTEDLLEVWKKNDRQEWTDEAFEAIRQVLSARIGSLPPQGEDAASEAVPEMGEELREQRIEQHRLNMEEQDTEELLEVWKKNDRHSRTDEAFQAIRQVLSARIGSLPPQGEDGVGD